MGVPKRDKLIEEFYKTSGEIHQGIKIIILDYNTVDILERNF